MDARGEIASPSTALIDRTTKLDLHERAGVPCYWMVDPTGPTITVLELREGRYGPPVELIGDVPVRLHHPHPLSLTAVGLRR